MKKLIFLLISVISILLLVSCDGNFSLDMQDRFEEMSNNIKDGIIDAVGPFIEKDTSSDLKGDEVIDNDTGSLPSDIPSDIPSDVPSDIPSDVPSDIPSDVPSDIVTDSDSGNVPDEPDEPVIPEIPEYIVLEREKYPLNKYVGLDIFRDGSSFKDKEYKFRTAYGYGRYETTLDELMGTNPLTYFSISGMESNVHIDFDLSESKFEAAEDEIPFSEISVKILEFAKKYCVNSLTSNLKRLEIGSYPDNSISAKDYALLLNLIYDNNCKQNGYDVENPGTTFINPNIRLITGKMSTINLPYVKELMNEVELLRDDDFLPIGGWSFSVNTKGKTPEEIFFENEALKELIAYRNENYNSIEILLNDIAWDTVNEESEQYVAPSSNYTSEELQAMYILRSYLLLNGMDVDKVSYDLLNDTETNGSGIIDKNGNKKLSFTLLEYFKTKMNGMYLKEVVSNGENNVFCYKYENEKGKTVYAFWSPEGATVNIFDLPESVTLSYYNPTSKSYEDMEKTQPDGLFYKLADSTVMFVEY